METFKTFIMRELEQTQAGNFFYDFLNYKLDFSESDVTVQFLERMREYALERVSPNSSRTYLSYFKTGFYKAERSGYQFPVNFDDVAKYLFVRPEASEHVFTTPEELKMLEMYTPSSTPERYARLVYLLCSYVGCRVGDHVFITEANYRNGELNYTAGKTKRSSRLPLHPLVPGLVKELREFNYPEQIAAAMVGQYIKIIFKKLGVDEIVTLYQKGKRITEPKWKFISSHTARRSFATNCYLSGYAIKQISGMMGHSTTGQTERYIISSFADEITEDKTYLCPDRVTASKADKAREKLDAMQQMMRGLGISEGDALSIIRKVKECV